MKGGEAEPVGHGVLKQGREQVLWGYHCRKEGANSCKGVHIVKCP